MINTVGQLREFLDMLDDNEPVVFVVVHPDDKKLLARSIDNKVNVVLNHPIIILHAIAAGKGGSYKRNEIQTIQTIFLTSK